VSLRTIKLGTNKFKDNIRYSGRDLINSKNIAAKKMGDSNSPIIFYTRKINWKAVLSGNSKAGQELIRNDIIVIVFSFHLR
jgi:hypothetical protein